MALQGLTVSESTRIVELYDSDNTELAPSSSTTFTIDAGDAGNGLCWLEVANLGANQMTVQVKRYLLGALTSIDDVVFFDGISAVLPIRPLGGNVEVVVSHMVATYDYYRVRLLGVEGVEPGELLAAACPTYPGYQYTAVANGVSRSMPLETNSAVADSLRGLVQCDQIHDIEIDWKIVRMVAGEPVLTTITETVALAVAANTVTPVDVNWLGCGPGTLKVTNRSGAATATIILHAAAIPRNAAI